MNTVQGDTFIQEVTGDGPVYPGHPMVLAAAIMAVFHDYSSASKATEHGWCAALGDQRIPGAGDHVGAAMRCLKIGNDGGTADQMVEYANRYWVSGNAGGHHKNVQAGIEQASVMESTFRELARSWFSCPATTPM